MNKERDNGNAAAVPSDNGSLAQGILVLGMHRSGTSACTRVLNLLGCALPNQLVGEGEGNETGHWESTEVLSLNEEMLESVGSSHDDWGPMNADWRTSAIRSQMVLRASKVLADHAKLGPLFAIKDPRMCRIADVWLEAAIEARVEPLVILMLRNPVEVAASLEARDLMATGYGELLWLRHVLDAEFYTRGRTRVICRYDQLLNNWQGLIAKIKSELLVAFPRNSPKIQAEIGQFLSQSHRHHTADPALVIDDPGYSHWLRRTLEIMLAWSERGEDASDFPVLDEIRSELDRAFGAFAKLLLAQELTGEPGLESRLRSELMATRNESERKVEALQLATDSAEDALAAAAERETALATQIDVEAAHAKSLQSEIEWLSAEVAARTKSAADAAALQLELSERTAELASVRSALSDVHEAVNTERERRVEAEERLAGALQDLHEQQLRNAELAGQVSASQSALIQRQEELAQLFNRFGEAERLRVRAQAECEQERNRRIQSEECMTSADAEINALQLNLGEARRAADRKVDALTTDLARLAKLLQEQEEATDQAAVEASASAAETLRQSQEVKKLSEAATTAQAARVEAERKLAARFEELARLTVLTADEASRADFAEDRAQWLCEVRRVEEGFPTWWAIMPRIWRRRRAHRRYHQAGLFDAEAYLALYPDVSAQGMDPIRHFILHGMAEGRARPLPT